jgi:hypothetical protein
MMRLRKLLLKLAHRVLKKYGVIPLDFKDKVLFMGNIYEIQSYVISKEFFKTDVAVEMCDCFKFPDCGGS